MRIGIGFDIHRLTAGRPLLLGGVTIPAQAGAEGHSDADVLLHALTDALLGAAGAGDIGTHFPDTDPKWKGAASGLFVAEALRLAQQKGYRVANADLMVLAEAPKLVPSREKIVGAVAALLKVEPGRVNFKARTMERLGPIGEGRAIAAWVSVLLEPEGDR